MQTFIVPKIVMFNIQKSSLLVGALCTKLFNRRDCLKTEKLETLLYADIMVTILT